MKLKVKKKSYDEVMALKIPKHKKPLKPSLVLRTVANLVSLTDLWKAKYKTHGKLPPKSEGPFLVLMNHSSFIDLPIAQRIMFPRPVSIVCTYDAFIGKKWLLRGLGCIPTRKFITDLALIHDMKHALSRGVNVLMYPEAGYSLDGTATVIPKLGKLVKMLGVPVVFIKTEGAFTRDPLYNELKIRKVPVSANVSTLITKEDIQNFTADELDKKLDLAFTFDNFAWQKENKIITSEPTRADGLERTLYLCPHCGAEGFMHGEGIKIRCDACGKSYTMSELGELKADEGETEFSHIPDWFRWQREKVKAELLDGSYSLDIPVRIGIMNDFKALYTVGTGRLSHTLEGFHLTGCEGKLDYSQKALSSYTLNADFFWYELGDIICISDSNALYYCFPDANVPVAKARLATEELYKLHQDREFHLNHCKECNHPLHEEFTKRLVKLH